LTRASVTGIYNMEKHSGLW